MAVIEPGRCGRPHRPERFPAGDPMPMGGDLLAYLDAFRREVLATGADPVPVLLAMVPVLVACGRLEAACVVKAWTEG